MLATSSDEIVVITTKDNKQMIMNLGEYTRWHCLLEAMEYIDHKAKEINKNLENSNDWIKPLALQKYIRERFLSMKHDIKSVLAD